MIHTHRRMNLLQAWKRCGGGVRSRSEMMLMGAYGSPQSIDRAMRRLALQGAVEIFKYGDTGDRAYRFTTHGQAALGMVPERQADGDR